MGFTFVQVNNAPEVATSSRYKIYFPAIAGVDTKILSMMATHVNPPSKEIGHIQVRLFDQSVGFRGGRVTGNQFTVSFYENVYGDVLKAIRAWMDLVRDKEGRSQLKRNYAFNCLLEVYNTVGESFHTVDLINVYPLSYDYPELNDSSTTAFEFTVTFNQDASELE